MDKIKLICKELFFSNNTKLYMAGLAFFLAVLLTGNQHTHDVSIDIPKRTGAPQQELQQKQQQQQQQQQHRKIKTYKVKIFQKILEEYRKNYGEICTTQKDEKSIKNGTMEKKNKTREDLETTSYMVIYIPVLLLQISLILSIFEIFKDSKGKKERVNQKPVLNRTCSLADITLMRHQRRESMRKDFGHQEQHDYPRFPHRQIGDGDQFLRRCSVPVGPGVLRKPSIFSSRSLDTDSSNNLVEEEIEPPRERRRSHMRLLHRH